MKRDDLGAAVRGLLSADRVIQERCLSGGDWRPPPAAADLAHRLASSSEACAVSEGQEATTTAVFTNAAAAAITTAPGANGEVADANVDATVAAYVDGAHTAVASHGQDADADIGATTAASGRDARDSRLRCSGHGQPDMSLWRQLGEAIDEQRYGRWRLAEKQLQQYFALLQARGAAAARIALLRAERERLQEAVEQMRTDPINQHLQLPPTLLLNSSLSGLEGMAAMQNTA